MNIEHILRWFAVHPYIVSLLGTLLLFLLAWSSLLITRRYLLRSIAALVKRSPKFWRDVLIDKQVFQRLVWILPIFIVNQGIMLVPHLPASLVEFVKRLAMATLVIVIVRMISAVLSSINDIYNRHPMAKNRPIKGYLQVIQILVHIAGAVFIVAILANQSPWYFVSGLGAMMAIILLVFRDTLLSLVAGIQLTNNDLIRVGDWIEMPQFNADGDVIDIALHAVMVQNWDSTVTVIPTHKFLEHSFKNWRGMFEGGGRRIMRSIVIDLNTVGFLSEAEIAHLGKFSLLREYISQKLEDIEAYNREHRLDPNFDVTARRLTNIGTFRAYIIEYLRQHPKVHQEKISMVRQLAPGPTGLPIEVYIFTTDTAWPKYEAIQADIFDHLIAVVPEFGLRVYQQPSGHDFARLTSDDKSH